MSEVNHFNILLVDDNDGFADSTRNILELSGYKVTLANSVATAKNALKVQVYTHVLLDLMLPDGSGLNVLEDCTEEFLSVTRVIIITGHPIVKKLVKQLVGKGLSYLIKPFTFTELKESLNQAANQDKERSPQTLESVNSSALLLGESSQIQKVREMVASVAATDANVLLLGESGTGKEVIAQLIHRQSKRSGKMVSCNCGAISRELITSELFGHEKGAFTGATSTKIGLFEEAHYGTLFLDEVTEMPIDMQPTLLRAIETRSVSRIGSSKQKTIDCRIVSATNKSEASIAEKQFLREDLYFRLAAFPIHIPPLRDREGDITLLAKHFTQQFNKSLNKDIDLSSNVLRLLNAYTWPGNIRELKHTIQRAVILARSGDSLMSLPENWQSPFSSENSLISHVNVGRRLKDIEKDVVLQTLEAFDRDRGKTAEVLGISIKTLYNKLQQYS